MTHTRCPSRSLTSRTVALTFVFQLTSLCMLLTSLTFALTPDPQHYHDYCLIGAGPAGLQIGYFLQKNNRDYMIFERSNISGHFFVDYPRHRKLISINKRFTGKTNKEFNLRHDWNSLISDDESLLFKEYSKEMFPHADRLVDYLRDYQQKLGIKVQFNTEINNIRNIQNDSAPDGLLQLLDDQHGNTYACRVLIVATGMWKPNIPEVAGMDLVDGYETMNIDPAEYEGKTVLILGHGNTAFEVADSIYGSTNLIHMLSRSRIRLSWETHYVGDLRAVNNGLLDTYQLKSLDGIIEGGVETMLLKRNADGKIVADGPEEFDNSAIREPYDRVIRCLGFTFDTSIFGNETNVLKGRGRAKKYVALKHNYESKNMPGVFVAGTASHSLDFRKSAGGFIHGFRYTARALAYLLENRYEGVPWPSVTIPVTQLTTHMLKRLNEGSGFYQMFQVLGDVAILSEDGETVRYLEEFPIKLLDELPKYSGHNASRILAVVLEYGPDFSGPGKDIFRSGRAVGDPSEAHESNFLHPVLYYYETLPTAEQMASLKAKEVLPRPTAIHHIVEDFLTLWDAPKTHITPLRKFVDFVTGSDLRARFAQPCLLETMTFSKPSAACRDQFLQEQAMTFYKEMHGTIAVKPLTEEPLKMDQFY